MNIMVNVQLAVDETFEKTATEVADAILASVGGAPPEDTCSVTITQSGNTTTTPPLSSPG